MNPNPTSASNAEYTFPTVFPVPNVPSPLRLSDDPTSPVGTTGVSANTAAITQNGTECEWEMTDFIQTNPAVVPLVETYYSPLAQNPLPQLAFPLPHRRGEQWNADEPTVEFNEFNKGPEHSTTLHRPQSTQVWNTAFSRVDMRQAIDLANRTIQARRPEYFITANLNYLMLTEEHPRLSEVNENCACMLADGFPIVLRSRLGKRPLPCRVAGSDMIVELAKMASEKGYRVFFLGGATGVAQAAADQLQSRFPKLQVAGVHSPPFRALSVEEQSEMIHSIRAARTDILLVAFGQPKGEFWIYNHREELGVPLSIQLGASFDFLAGTARRAPRIWQMVGCEWLYRALNNPLRLVPRYAKNLCFLGKLLVWEVKDLIERIAGRPLFGPLERLHAQLKQLDQQSHSGK